MRYQVPQFIDVEDKIFGPMTLKQFIYMTGGAGLSFVIYVVIGSFLWSLPFIVAVMAISAALAFFKVYNHFPLITVAEAAFKYWVGSKLYIWKKESTPQPEDMKKAIREAKKYATVSVPKISDSKLKDLSWSIDVKNNLNSNNI